MIKLVNRAKMTTATTGTGNITLGSAVDGFQTFADAGVANFNNVRYVIEDGDAWEIGRGTYFLSSGTENLFRNPSESSNAGSAINLSGDAVVYVAAAAEDLASLGVGQTWQSFTTTGGSPQRQPGVTYTNTTGKPIVVNVAGAFFNVSTLRVDNIAVGLAFVTNFEGFASVRSTMTAVVPQNSTYGFFGDTPDLWRELR